MGNVRNRINHRKYRKRRKRPDIVAGKRKRLNRQAFELIQERIRLFGGSWRDGLAFKVPTFVEELLAKHGVEEFLLMEWI